MLSARENREAIKAGPTRRSQLEFARRGPAVLGLVCGCFSELFFDCRAPKLAVGVGVSLLQKDWCMSCKQAGKKSNQYVTFLQAFCGRFETSSCRRIEPAVSDTARDLLVHSRRSGLAQEFLLGQAVEEQQQAPLTWKAAPGKRNASAEPNVP